MLNKILKPILTMGTMSPGDDFKIVYPVAAKIMSEIKLPYNYEVVPIPVGGSVPNIKSILICKKHDGFLGKIRDLFGYVEDRAVLEIDPLSVESGALMMNVKPDKESLNLKKYVTNAILDLRGKYT